jgi:hypothetical protein
MRCSVKPNGYGDRKFSLVVRTGCAPNADSAWLTSRADPASGRMQIIQFWMSFWLWCLG